MICFAQDDGRYVPDNFGFYVSTGDEGKYIHDDSGRYIPDYSGLYHHDGKGRYTYDGSGKYRDQLGKNISRSVPEYSFGFLPIKMKKKKQLKFAVGIGHPVYFCIFLKEHFSRTQRYKRLMGVSLTVSEMWPKKQVYGKEMI